MKLVFLHTSDLHGFLLPTDYQDKNDYTAAFSLSRVSTVVKKEEKKWGRSRVIVTDAGDCLQGSPLAAYTHASMSAANLHAFAAAYNAIAYDARCLGNHDFNFGLSYLSDYVEHTRAPMINGNVLDAQTAVPYFGKEYEIIERKGFKIGIIGVTTPFVSRWEPAAHVAGLRFVSAFSRVQHYAQILRPQVDILAVLYHGGFESNPLTGQATEPHRGENEGYRMLTAIPAIDLLLTGHQHRRLSLVTRQTAIVQPGYRGEAVAEVVVDLDESTHKIRSLSTKLIDTKNYAPDPQIVKLVKSLDQKTQVWLDQPIAHLPQSARLGQPMQARLTGSPFINLLQQMQLYFTKADVSATAVMSETARGFGQIVTLRDILLNYPYANQLCRVKVTGRQLRHLIEHSLSFLQKDEQGKIGFCARWLKPKPQLYNFDLFYPVHYEADISKPAGHRLTKLTLHGHSLQDQQIYHLAVNNYRAMGGGFYPEYSPDKIEFTLGQDYPQLFRTYLTQAKVHVDQGHNFHFY